MNSKKFKRVGVSILTAIMMLQSMTITSFALDEVHTTVRTNSQTQMSSEPEIVYMNSYSNPKIRKQNFDSNWKFSLGDASGANSPEFNDSKWDSISVPHDYSIIQKYDKNLDAESGYLPGGVGWYRKHFKVSKEMQGKRLRLDFDGVYMNATVYINGKELGTHPFGYTPFSFDITDHVKYGEENVISVKVDHKTPSSRWYSGSGIYRSVNLSVMDKVHVDLYGTKIETPNLEQQKNGTVDMKVKTTVANDSKEPANVVLTHTIFKKGQDASKNIGTVTTTATSVAAGAKTDIEATLPANKPELWDTENPNLYTVVTEVKVDNKVVDKYDTEYGFRYFKMNNQTGASLNGKDIKLKGVCMHHDQGSLGSAAYRRAIERQVEILKDMGCNSIRVTHNPAATDLIEICNEKGMLVIDEMFDGWHNAKNENSNDYSKWFNKTIEENNTISGKRNGMTWAEFDLKSAIKRGQNSPSIIMWSLGNEIQEGTGIYTGYANKAKDLIKWAREVDTTKLLTIGSNQVKNEITALGEHTNIANQLTEVGGASGTNYSSGDSYDKLHEKNPKWNLYGSETASAINSRGIYTTKVSGGNSAANLDKNKQLTSYDKSKVPWGAFASEAWYEVIKRDFVAGEYVWTGFDYIGEPTPANGITPGARTSWPSPKNSYFGIIDTAGFPKDSYYFYQSQWNDKVKTLHILPTWNEDSVIIDKDKTVEVVVYSDAPKVKLFLNDEEVGEQQFVKVKSQGGKYEYQKVKDSKDNHESLYMTFKVPYKAGTLKAVAYDENNNVIENTQGRSEVKTTGKASKLVATADRKEIKADGKDLTYVTVDVTDKDGNIVPNADNRVKFDVKGDGVLVGVDNGSSPDHDSYKADNRKAFSGKVLAIVQSTKQDGKFTVTATSDNLQSSRVEVKTVPTKTEGTTPEKQIDNFKMVKNYYVKIGNKPQFEKQIEVRYTDGSVEKKDVKWAEPTKDQLSKEGTFILKGTVDENTEVYVNVTMIDTVVALLNYSTNVQLGQKPVLPDERPAVLADGTVLSASFAVNWDKVDDKVYSKPGVVEVKGTASVLGKELKVSTFVRVEEEKITIGDNIASAGRLSQDIPENLQSDNLEAIKDGVKEYKPVLSGKNKDVWSNYDNSQKGGEKANQASINFNFDTQQRVGEITVYFFKDNWSARYPDPKSTKIVIDSEKELEVKETITDFNKDVKAYKYEFAPTLATTITLKIKNSTTEQALNPEIRACTGITEVEIKKAEGNYTTNTTAQLSQLVVNGKEVSQDVLASGVYKTPALVAKVEAKPADNAAMTILPVYKDVVKIILESEDHNTTKVFEIQLNKEAPLTPDSAELDYPVEKMQITVGSEQAGGANAKEGPKNLVIDGKKDTWWHTSWSGANANKPENRWIAFHLEKPAKLNALRYYPRTDNSPNGKVKKYKVEISNDENVTEQTNWEQVATGDWDTTKTEWMIADFGKEVTAKHIRLTGVETESDNTANKNKLMSASEIRLRTVKETVDITKPENKVTVTLEPEKITVPSIDENNLPKPVVTVKVGEKVLEYGIDYKVTYEGNDKFGEAKAIIEGIINYSGKIEKPFMIEKSEKELEAIFVKKQPAKTIYKAGETFDPNGLVITLSYNDKTTEDVAYNDSTASKFTFTPALTEKLKESDKQVNVTYAGKSAVVDITVRAESSQITITFVIDGKETKVDIGVGQSVGNKLPKAPAKDGYKFIGWNTKENGTGVEVTAETKFEESMKVYAIYEKVSHTVNPSEKPNSNTNINSNNQNNSNNGSHSDLVQTGDTINVTAIVIIVILMGVSLVVIGVVIMKKKNNKRK